MTLISTACSWVNMFGGHKAAIFTQVGQFYFGRWVSFSSAVTCLLQRNQVLRLSGLPIRHIGMGSAPAATGQHDG